MSNTAELSKARKFYALTPEELLELNRLLKDAELRVYLYLVTNHPFSDRKVETDTAIIAEHLGLTRRTIQRAIRTLEELELIEIELSRFKYCQSRRKVKEKLRATDGSPKRQIDHHGDRRIAETTARSPKRQQDRFCELEPLIINAFESSNTINTFKTFHTEEEVLKNEEVISITPSKPVEERSPSITPSKLVEERSPSITPSKLVEENSITPSKPVEERSPSITPSKLVEENSITPSKINSEIVERLRSLSIPINKKVMEAIERKTEKEVIEVLEHIKEAGESIKSPLAIFLYRMNKLTVTEIVETKISVGRKLSEEFLEWYRYARGEQVEDIEPEYLPFDRYGEPLVRLKGDTYNRLIEWQRVRNGEDFEVCRGEALKTILDKIRHKIQGVKDGSQL